MIPMQKILITGAGGFIGSHTTDTLLAAGKEVIGIDNFSTGNRDNLAEAEKSDSFTLIEGDITVPGVIEAAVAEHRPDSIVHLAALVSVPAGEEDPGKNFNLNVIATQQVAEAAAVARSRVQSPPRSKQRSTTSRRNRTNRNWSRRPSLRCR